jgi:hypothetical protein
MIFTSEDLHEAGSVFYDSRVWNFQATNARFIFVWR